MDRLKPQWQFWFWRIYVAAIALWHNATAALWLGSYDDAYMRANLYAWPLTLLAVLGVCGVFVFPWQHSAFGKYRRRPLPNSEPLCTIGESWESFRFWAGAGRFSMGSVVWLLYHDGIGIKTLCGKVFIPLDEIDGLDLLHGFDRLHLRTSTATLFHHCPEIREPVALSKWAAQIVGALP